MVALPSDRHTELTVEQYLVLEADAPLKHEFYNGELIAMSGARRNHVLITGSVAAELRAQLAQRPDCSAFASDMRVRVSETIYFYPDVVVAFDEQYADSSQLTLVNPALIVEVTSQSTALYDRTTKLEAYKRMPSVQDILIIDQHRMHIDHYTRMADGWLVRDYIAEADEITLDSIGCTVAISGIYAKVSFSG